MRSSSSAPTEGPPISVVSSSEALSCIREMNGLVKMVSVRPDSERCFNHLVKQLETPESYRPTKTLPRNIYRHRLFNPKTGEWQYRPVEEQDRGGIKFTEYTKKTALSLLPSDGVSKLFTPKHGFPLGFVFDLRQCNLKDEKYIFAANAETDKKWWLKQSGMDEATPPGTRALTLTTLRERLTAARARHQVPEWNEVLAGLSKRALKGLLIVNNTLENRLLALDAKLKIMDRLKINVPLLIMTPATGTSVYTAEQQADDLRSASTYDFFELADSFIRDLKRRFLSIVPAAPVATSPSTGTSGKLSLLINPRLPLPKELKINILSGLSLADLLLLKNSIKNEAKAAETSFLVQEVIEKNRAQDLHEVFSLFVRANVITEFNWTENPSTFIEYTRALNDNLGSIRAIINYSSDPKNKKFLKDRNELVKRFLAHLYYSKNTLFKEALSKVSIQDNTWLKWAFELGINFSEDVHSISLFYTLSPLLSSSDFKKAIDGISSLESITASFELYFDNLIDTGGEYYKVELVREGSRLLSPLTVMLLKRGRAEIIVHLAKKFPDQIRQVFLDIDYLITRKISLIKMPSEGFETPLNTDGVEYFRSLLMLWQPQKANYKFSHHEKRKMEGYLIQKISSSDTETELDELWNNSKDCACLSQHRHPWFDGLFRAREHVPSIKATVLAALESRRGKLRTDRSRATMLLN